MKIGTTPLEQLVVRINQLLEPESASVVWNPPVVDPHTKQRRQVDGMICRDGKRVHIECRGRTAVQDVKWIEDLIGRRESLQADGIIAVSTSGFTKPAIKKAEWFGIFLRNLQELSDDEIRGWGETVSLAAQYIHIIDAKVAFAISDEQARDIPIDPVLCLSQDRRGLDPWLVLIERLIHQEQCRFFCDRSTTIKGRIVLPGLLIGSVRVIWSDVTLVTRMRQETVSVLGQWSYGQPGAAAQVDAAVAHYDLGGTELIQTGDAASLTVDLSGVVVPPGCVPYGWLVDLGRTLKVRPKSIGRGSVNISGIRFENAIVGVAVGA